MKENDQVGEAHTKAAPSAIEERFRVELLNRDPDNLTMDPRAYIGGMGRAARRRELRQKRKGMELSLQKKFPLGSRHSRRLFSRLNLVEYYE